MNHPARWLHPGAWWIWALGLGAAASRTANPLLLGLIVAVAAVVVAHRRPHAEWANAFGLFLRLALFVIVVRVGFALLMGVRFGTTVLFVLPTVRLPAWMAGVTMGGEVTAEMVLFAAVQGAQLATLLICVGAANSLASAARLVKSLPAGLYYVGVISAVALSLAPRMAVNVRRVMQVRRLRGRRSRGLRAVAEAAIPVFEASLDDAVSLAAGMDTRGYGRAVSADDRGRRFDSALILGGLVGLAIGLYGVLDATAFGWPLLVLGVALAVTGMTSAGRRITRTRYRPDPWAGPEWLTAGVGLAAMVALLLAQDNSLSLPLTWPTLPVAATAAVLLAALPAVLTPPPPLPWGSA